MHRAKGDNSGQKLGYKEALETQGVFTRVKTEINGKSLKGYNSNMPKNIKPRETTYNEKMLAEVSVTTKSRSTVKRDNP